MSVHDQQPSRLIGIRGEFPSCASVLEEMGLQQDATTLHNLRPVRATQSCVMLYIFLIFHISIRKNIYKEKTSPSPHIGQKNASMWPGDEDVDYVLSLQEMNGARQVIVL